MKNCWLSPQGTIYFCCNHIQGAKHIIEECGLTNEFEEVANGRTSFSVERFFELKGYIKYSDIKVASGWCIIPGTRLTKAQINKIYELTGEFFDEGCLL